MWPTELCPPEKEEELGALATPPPCVLVDGMDTPPEVTTTLDTIPVFSILELSKPHRPSGTELLIVLERLTPMMDLHIPETDSIFVGRHLGVWFPAEGPWNLVCQPGCKQIHFYRTKCFDYPLK